MLAKPIARNSDFGCHTNFVNLLDYAAIAVPAGFRPDGLPCGVTFVAQAHQDQPLLHLAQRWQRAAGQDGHARRHRPCGRALECYLRRGLRANSRGRLRRSPARPAAQHPADRPWRALGPKHDHRTQLPPVCVARWPLAQAGASGRRRLRNRGGSLGTARKRVRQLCR